MLTQIKKIIQAATKKIKIEEPFQKEIIELLYAYFGTDDQAAIEFTTELLGKASGEWPEHTEAFKTLHDHVISLNLYINATDLPDSEENNHDH